MPEGDTVWQAAQRLNAALAGQVLTKTDFRVPKFATADLTGRTVQEVVARGKHLLIRADGMTIHSHLKMEGQWQVYPRGDRWRRPAFQARAVLENAASTAVGFELGLLEIIPTDEEEQTVGYLGPDLLGPDWDAAEAERRLAAAPDRALGVALLDQRNLAGIGNVFCNELCFLVGVHPLSPVSAVPDLRRLVALSKQVLEFNRNRQRRSTAGSAGAARGRGSLVWVYGRDGKPCLRCGTTIRQAELGASDLELRVTYFCPHCQAPPAPGAEGTGSYAGD